MAASKTCLSAAAAIALVLAGCEPPARSAGGFRVDIPAHATHFTLANGLEVILAEDHRTPFVAVNVRYHVGAKDDPPQREGLAHLYEHLMFSGSAHVARDEFLPTLDRLGARAYNGATTRDDTDYFETVPSGALDAAIFLEADRMRTAFDKFDDATLAREKGVVDAERRLRVDDTALGGLSAIMADALYPPGHPYRHAAIGSPESVHAISLDDLRTFHDRYYGPDDATLVLVGDFDPAKARELVEKYFGPTIPTKSPPALRRLPPVLASSTPRIRVDANVSYSAVHVTWPLPARGQPGFYESWGALVLAGWTVGTRARERGLSSSVTSNFESDRLGTVGDIRATLLPGANADAFVDLVGEVIRSLSRASSLTYWPQLRSEVIGTDLFVQEDLGSRASRIQFYDESYGDPNHVMPELRTLDALSSSHLIDAYDALLAMDNALVTVIVPDPQAPLAGVRHP